jgi:hypothetical protein
MGASRPRSRGGASPPLQLGPVMGLSAKTPQRAPRGRLCAMAWHSLRGGASHAMGRVKPYPHARARAAVVFEAGRPVKAKREGLIRARYRTRPGHVGPAPANAAIVQAAPAMRDGRACASDAGQARPASSLPAAWPRPRPGSSLWPAKPCCRRRPRLGTCGLMLGGIVRWGRASLAPRPRQCPRERRQRCKRATACRASGGASCTRRHHRPVRAARRAARGCTRYWE